MRVAVVIAVLFTSFGANALSDIPQVWKKNFSEFRLTTSYHNSKANFEERGSYEDLPSGGLFTNVAFRGQLRHNFGRKISAYAGTTLSRTSATAGSVTKENTALSEIFLGVTTTVWKTPSFILLGELEGSFSTDRIDPQTNESLTNDGVDFIFPRLMAKKMIKRFWIGGTLGMKVRDEGLSSLLMWSNRVGYRFSKIDLSAGFSGFESVIKDNVPISTRNAVTSRVNAGSLRFYSHNPALLQFDAALDWKLAQALGLSVLVSQTMDGTQYAAGYTAGLQLRYEFGLSKGSKGKALKKNPEKAFEIETNEVDPDLFEDEDQ